MKSFFVLCLVSLLFSSGFQAIPRVSPPSFSPMGQTFAREKPTLLLYYTSSCPYSQKVLEYLQKIHKTLPMKNLQGDSKGRLELKKIGGKTQVPCLIIDGQALYESDLIIHWLSQNRQILAPA